MQTIKNSSWRWARLFLALLAGFCWAGCMEPGPRALLDGAQLIQERKYGQAVERLKTATVRLPNNAQAWNHLGLAYHGQKEYREAIRAYQQALVLDRNLAAARFNLGCAYLEMVQPSAAVSELVTYTTLAPSSGMGWLKLGEAQFGDHQVAAAEKSFQNALRNDPRLVAALNDLGVLEAQRKRPNEAWKCFSAVAQQQPQYAPALLNLGILSQRHFGQLPMALAKYEAYLKANPAAPDRFEVEQMVRQLDAQVHPPPLVTAPLPADRETQSVAVARPSAVPQVKIPAAPLEPETNRAESHVTGYKSGALVETNAVAGTPKQQPNAPVVGSTGAAGAGARSNDVAAAVKSSFPPLQLKPVPEVVESVSLTNDFAVKPAGASTNGVSAAAPVAATNWYAGFPPPAEPRQSNLPPMRPMAPEAAPAPSVRIEKIAKAPKEKEPFYEKLNPVRWFRRQEKRPPRVMVFDSPPVTPQEKEKEKSNGAGSNASNAVETKGAVAMAARTAAAPSAAVAASRYHYQGEITLPSGDRASAEPVFNKAVTAQRQVRLREAIEGYEKAVSIDPAFFEAHFNLGLAAYQMQEWGLSLSAYERALSIKPTSADARYNFALALQRAGYVMDAVQELEKLVALHPGEARAHFTLANLYAQQLQEPEQAERHYRRVLELDPGHPQATAIRYWLMAHQ